MVWGALYEDSLELGDEMAINLGLGKDGFQGYPVTVGACVDVAYKTDRRRYMHPIMEEACGEVSRPTVHDCR